MSELPGGQQGRVQAWLRTAKTLIEGTDCSTTAAFVGLVDTAILTVRRLT